MHVVIPLAGPDFERADGSVKAEIVVGGLPLLRCAIESRPWWRQGLCGPGDLTFVLRDRPASRAFADERLGGYFPGSRTVWLGDHAQGAALSALAGVALTAHRTDPLVIDLADILFDSHLHLTAALDEDDALGAIALVFPSTNPAYSYLRVSEGGEVVEAAEKRVISSNASAGVYVYRTPATYLEALANVLKAPERHVLNGLFYVCPVYNGVLAAGRRVSLEHVDNVQDVKMIETQA